MDALEPSERVGHRDSWLGWSCVAAVQVTVPGTAYSAGSSPLMLAAIQVTVNRPCGDRVRWWSCGAPGSLGSWLGIDSVEIGVGEGERVGDLRGGRGLGCRDAGIVCGVVGFRGTRLWGFLWLKWARPRPYTPRTRPTKKEVYISVGCVQFIKIITTLRMLVLSFTTRPLKLSL